MSANFSRKTLTCMTLLLVGSLLALRSFHAWDWRGAPSHGEVSSPASESEQALAASAVRVVEPSGGESRVEAQSEKLVEQLEPRDVSYLEDLLSLEVNLVDAETGVALAGHPFSVYSQHRLGFFHEDKTDRFGRAMVEEVTTNIVVVRTQRSPPYAVSFDAIALDPSVKNQITVKVHRGGVVTGRVVFDSGAPIRGALVNTKQGAHAVTTEDGHFRLEALASVGRDIWLVNGQARPESWDEIEVEVDRQGEVRSWRVRLGPGDLRVLPDTVFRAPVLWNGVVYEGRFGDSASTPLEGVHVAEFLSSHDQDPLMTDSQGRFELEVEGDRLGYRTTGGRSGEERLDVAPDSEGCVQQDIYVPWETKLVVEAILPPGSEGFRGRVVLETDRGDRSSWGDYLDEGSKPEEFVWRVSPASVRALRLESSPCKTARHAFATPPTKGEKIQFLLEPALRLKFDFEYQRDLDPQLLKERRYGSGRLHCCMLSPEQRGLQVELGERSSYRPGEVDTCCGSGSRTLSFRACSKQFSLKSLGDYWLYFHGPDGVIRNLGSYTVQSPGLETAAIVMEPDWFLKPAKPVHSSAHRTPPQRIREESQSPPSALGPELEGHVTFRAVDSQTREGLEFDVRAKQGSSKASWSGGPEWCDRVWLTPGPWTLEIESEGYQQQTVELEVAWNGFHRLEVKLIREPYVFVRLEGNLPSMSWNSCLVTRDSIKHREVDVPPGVREFRLNLPLGSDGRPSSRALLVGIDEGQPSMRQRLVLNAQSGDTVIWRLAKLVETHLAFHHVAEEHAGIGFNVQVELISDLDHPAGFDEFSGLLKLKLRPAQGRELPEHIGWLPPGRYRAKVAHPLYAIDTEFEVQPGSEVQMISLGESN